jgi:DnaK suppressor protein
MDKGTLKYFREILNDHLTEVERGIVVALSNLDGTRDIKDPMDEVDATANRSAWEDMIRMQHRSRKSAIEINTALQRIRKGDFGICTECGESIGFARLKAHPMTTVCIRCKRKTETVQRRKVA